MTNSLIREYFTIASTKTFELQHQGSVTRNNNGFGLACNFTTEVY
jgi:hypothetical protein